ncbi:hypothetical protein BIW11_03598 [Tropilaelaps mercedesae]|uniref:Uncharacterized protein n=1 Tax=Tropilaelaps mercedesae TaxID=418985 RepID=A0A1V9XIS7_9ACAR|nr:hypothetical protein BIW11_03598 [Tropilaelaps mercedesae]
MAASNLPDTICQSFKNNPACDSLLPPKGTRPSGKSNSSLSLLAKDMPSNLVEEV